MPDRIFFCDCGGSALVVSSSLDWEDGEYWIEISPWVMADRDDGLRSRLRQVWNIIRYGHPYADFVIYRPQQARELAECLWGIAGAPATGDGEASDG